MNPLIAAAGAMRKAGSTLKSGVDEIDPKWKPKKSPNLKPGVDYIEDDTPKVNAPPMLPGVDYVEPKKPRRRKTKATITDDFDTEKKVLEQEKELEKMRAVNKALSEFVKNDIKRKKTETKASLAKPKKKKTRRKPGQPHKKIVRGPGGRFTAVDEPDKAPVVVSVEPPKTATEKKEEQKDRRQDQQELKQQKKLEQTLKPFKRTPVKVDREEGKPVNQISPSDFKKYLEQLNKNKNNKRPKRQTSPTRVRDKEDGFDLIGKLGKIIFGALMAGGILVALIKTIGRDIGNYIIDGLNKVLSVFGIEIPKIEPVNNPSMNSNPAIQTPALTGMANTMPPPGQVPASTVLQPHAGQPAPSNPPTLGASQAPATYRPVMEAAGKAYGIDPQRLHRTALAESNYDPDIISGRRMSPAGAGGLMQFMPGTAQDMGINRFDPNQSIMGAAKYLAQLDRMFGNNHALSHMAYNWGPGNVQKWVRNGADPRAVPQETRDYVRKVVPGASVETALNYGRNVPSQNSPVPMTLPPPNVGSMDMPTGNMNQSNMSMIAPVKGPITSEFGHRASPGGKGSTNHQGVDIAVPVGTPVVSPASGKVIGGGASPGYGYYIDIQHDNGLISRFGHLSNVLARGGQIVQQGETVALSGNTGVSTGPHLHMEVRKNGRLIDPKSVVTGLGPSPVPGNEQGAPSYAQINPTMNTGTPTFSIPQQQNASFVAPSMKRTPGNIYSPPPTSTSHQGLEMNDIQKMFQEMTVALTGNLGGLVSPVLQGLGAIGNQLNTRETPNINSLHIRDPRIASFDRISTSFVQRRNINPAG